MNNHASPGTSWVRVPWYPLYAHVKNFAHAVDGQSAASYRALRQQIVDLRGSPQSTVDWTNPDEWIDVRLKGSAIEIARRIWSLSDRTLNPRHTNGAWFLIRVYDLMQERDGVLSLTTRGAAFCAEPDGAALHREIDASEGLFAILSLVAAKGSGKRGDFLDGWNTYLSQHSSFKADSVVKDTLRRRLQNLVDRGLLDRRGNSYEIGPTGIAYLAADPATTTSDTAKRNEVVDAAERRRRDVRAALLEHLETMDPTLLETLVKRLLLEMGYQDAETTAKSNDGGVDVVADIELGITRVREVVQVKRRARANVGRRVLDELRGSLYRFQALKGTIITTAGFSSGAKAAAVQAGAAPITLIDGQRLVDLLVEYGLGVRKQRVEILELELDSLSMDDEDPDEDLVIDEG